MAGLDKVLDDLHRQLSEFNQALEQEAQALRGMNLEDMQALVDRKNQLSAALANSWRQLLNAAGGPVQGAEVLQRVTATPPERQAKWQAIREQAQRSEQLNHANGLLIEAQLRRTRQALDILQTSANRAGVYGADGQMLDYLGGRRSIYKA